MSSSPEARSTQHSAPRWRRRTRPKRRGTRPRAVRRACQGRVAREAAGHWSHRAGLRRPERLHRARGGRRSRPRDRAGGVIPRGTCRDRPAPGRQGRAWGGERPRGRADGGRDARRGRPRRGGRGRTEARPGPVRRARAHPVPRPVRGGGGRSGRRPCRGGDRARGCAEAARRASRPDRGREPLRGRAERSGIRRVADDEGLRSPLRLRHRRDGLGSRSRRHDRRPPGPARTSRLRPQLHARPGRQGLRRPRDQRDLDRRGRGHLRAGRPGVQARPGRGAVREGGRLEDLPLQRRGRRGELPAAHVERLRRRGADLEQLVGHLQLRRLPRGLAGVRRAGA